MNSKDSQLVKNPPYLTSLPLCGFTCGVLAALITSELYIFGLGCVNYILTMNFLGALSIFIIGQFYGTIPSLMFGIILGTITGWLFQLLPVNFSRSNGALLGVLINLIIGSAIIYAVWLILLMVGIIGIDKFTNIQAGDYWFFLPMIILFMSAAAWGGIKLAECKSALQKPILPQ